MTRCPCCGFEPDKKYNFTNKIRELLLKRNRTARKLLTNISLKIQTKVPSENSQHKYFYFLQGINKINDDIVVWSIKRFIVDNHMNNTRGFAYLRSIIFNEDKNRDMRLKNEYARVGRPPSIKKIGDEDA
jgi:hypothetical protein